MVRPSTTFPRSTDPKARTHISISSEAALASACPSYASNFISFRSHSMLKVTLLCISMGAVGATMFGTRAAFAPAGEVERKTNDLSVSAGSANRLEVNVPIGQVTLISDHSRDLTVHVVRSAKRPLDSWARRWLDESKLTVENRGGVLTVRDHPFGRDSFINMDGDGSKGKGKDLDLDVQIHVPADLAAKLDVAAGQVAVRGNFRTLDAKVAAGVLSTDSVRCTGSMELHVGAGEVKMMIPSGANEEVSAAVGIGEIKGLPGSTKHKDSIHFGDHRTGRTGQGESKVNVHVGAGTIKVESRDQIIASISPEDAASTSDDNDGNFDFQMDDKVGDSIRKSIDLAMGAVQKSLGSVDTDVKVDLGDLKFDDFQDLKELKELKGFDSGVDKELQSELSQIGPEIRRALQKVKPELEMTLKDLKPEIERAIREAMAEVQRVMKAIKPEIERAMKEMKPEIDKAVRDAMKEIERAEKQIKERSGERD